MRTLKIVGVEHGAELVIDDVPISYFDKDDATDVYILKEVLTDLLNDLQVNGILHLHSPIEIEAQPWDGTIQEI